jgi:hypothetical protein
MGGTAGLFQQTQEQIMILTAVAFRALTAQLLPQCLFKHRQMADVVAAQQVVRGVVRLEVRHHGAADALGEQRFVAVQKTVRFSALPQLQDGLAHGIQSMGCQNVVVVCQRQIFPCCQLCGSVGVGGNALIFDLFIYDLLILLLIFLYDPLHVPVGGVRSIGKAELPVGRGLPHKGFQKFPQVFFRGIVQRGQHRDGGQTAVCRRFACHLCTLGFQHLFGGQVACAFAKAAAFNKARTAHDHGGQTLVLCQLHGIAGKLLGAFQPYVHIRPRRAESPCRRRRLLRCPRSFSGGRGSAMPPWCTSARSARWSGTPE